MITEDLVQYIKLQLDNNIPKYLIIAELTEVGWHIEDIEEGFLTVEKLVNSSAPEVVTSDVENKEAEKTVDKYRELPEEINTETLQTYNTPVTQNIETPLNKEIEKTPIEPEKIKIWTPTTVQEKTIETKPVEISEKLEEKKEEIVFSKETEIEPYRLEVEAKEKSEAVDTLELMPTINKTPFVTPTIPTTIATPIISTTPETLATPTLQNIARVAPTTEKKMSDIVQKNAMIASYPQDVLAAQKEEEEELAVPKKKKSFIKIGIIIFVVSLVAGMVFAFVEGYIKIPLFNVSFNIVKKDPKTVMLNAPDTISKFKSYKVETNLSISSPALSNITTGLSSGSVVTSKDRDSISIKAVGAVNNLEGKSVGDYLLYFKSSILEDDINSNLKYDGDNLYASIPNLSKILGDNAPEASTISFKLDQMDMVVPEFSNNVQDQIKRFDIYNIISDGVPIYVKNQMSSILKEFIGKLESVKKENENIHGIDTYHYELIADRQATKKLLADLANLFVIKITAEQKQNLDEAIGASSMSSFDVWIGKDNDNLYQIKFTVNTPLSRVLDLNDSGIADNEVKLEWTTTYYDIDIPNDIKIPEAEADMEGFIKTIKDKKIKNIISSFKSTTVLFKNAVGTFGSKSNPTGSCINPNPGSIFSPKGHNKGADQSVSSIAEMMNSLLSVTNGTGSCYSTSKAWALSAPLSTGTDGLTSNYYCADSMGNVSTLETPITGPVCK